MIDKVTLRSQLDTVLNELFKFVDSEENVTTNTFKRKNYPMFANMSDLLCSELRISSAGLLKFNVDDICNLRELEYGKVVVFTLLLNDDGHDRVYHQYSPGSLVGIKDDHFFQIMIDSSYTSVDELIKWLSVTMVAYVKEHIKKLQLV